MDQPSLFLSAGDPSGDNAGARLIEALKSKQPSLTLAGLGGRRLAALGQEQLTAPDRLAVLGFWEVAKQFFFFKKLMTQSVEWIKENRPAAVVLIDYPGFNLRLAERIKELGIPIIYYISPQVWAWGKKRIAQIERLVDRMLLILPFETDFYDATTVSHKFVGHYLLEDIPQEYISSPPPTEGSLLLMPGSRPQEVERMLPVMLDAATTFQKKHDVEIALAGVDNAHCRAIYDRYLKRAGAPLVSYHFGQTRKLIYQSALVLTASGTATLETAIIGRPMVVIYKTGFITYQIAKRVIELDKIALVNLVLNDRVVPELVQHAANADRIVSELEKLKSDSAYHNGIIAKLHKVPSLLGGSGASERTAAEIGRFLC